MIVRCWHGWTLPEDADAYENLLRSEILPEIIEKSGGQLMGIELLRRDGQHEVEFMTILRFATIEDVATIGADGEKAFVPGKARIMLARHEDHARHFEQRYAIHRENGIMHAR